MYDNIAELLVMKETTWGLSLKVIVQKLKTKEGSVRSAMQRIRKKTGSPNAVAIAMYAVKHFIVKL